VRAQVERHDPGRVADIGQDRDVLPPGERGNRREVDERSRAIVGDHDLTRLDAENPLGEAVADAARGVDPLVPTGDEPLAPHVDGGAAPVACRERETPERVAVEVDPRVVAEHEPPGEARQRVRVVERDYVRTRRHRQATLLSAATTCGQAGLGGSIGSKWPHSSSTMRHSSPAARAAAA